MKARRFTGGGTRCRLDSVTAASVREELPMPQAATQRADGVFEGGGVKGIAFAGAIAAAEEEAGVAEWVNVAGTSAGAIVAALLVAGFRAEEIRDVLADTD